MYEICYTLYVCTVLIHYYDHFSSNVLSHLDFSSVTPICSSLSLPVSIHLLLPISNNTGNKWLIVDTNKR